MKNSDSSPDLPSGAASQSDRRATLFAVAAAAALVGTGVAWWRDQDDVGDEQPDAAGSLWALEWTTPSGSGLQMQSFRGRPLLVNFWATWCPPCVEELPLINRFYVANRSNGWQVLGLAIDKLDAVQSFLARKPLDFPIGMAGLAGAELGRTLGNLSGGLPFSVVLGSSGAVLHRKMGRLSEEDLNSWVGLK